MIDQVNKKDCTGCHACYSVCPNASITMQNDSEGFLYPIINYQTCTKCNLCSKVCPVLSVVDVKTEPKAYALINNDEQIREKSSSGGTFWLLAEKTIQENGVVFGAAFDEKMQLNHTFAESLDEASVFRGSKYIQSNMVESFIHVEEFLKKGRKVLFTGTPCQIGGLKSFLRKDYNNLLCVDIICHGVPSPKVWAKNISFIENTYKSKVKNTSFRDKRLGWRIFSIVYLFENNKPKALKYRDDFYFRLFTNDAVCRPSCHNCLYKTIHRQSDMTIADFWGIENVLPELDDNKGTSLIFTNSKKGQEVFDIIKQTAKWQEVDINSAIKKNPQAIKSITPHRNREKIFSKLNKIPFDKLTKRYCVPSLPYRIKRKSKHLLEKLIK